MKDKLILIAIFCAFIFVLPLFNVTAEEGKEDDKKPPSTQSGMNYPDYGIENDGYDEASDIVFNVFNVSKGEVMEISGREYITHVVAAEMPASFSEEALKAQTVAAFTYALHRKNLGEDYSGEHEGCELCTDSTHCKGYAEEERLRLLWGDNYDAYMTKIQKAVNEVYGEYIAYEGKPISAVFHSLSSGVTESAVNIWGHEYPYLVSVDSSLDRSLEGYETKVTVDKDELKKIMSDYSDKCEFDKKPQNWIGETVRSEAGTVLTIELCGVILSGGKARSLFSLRSANFTVEYSKDSFVFTVHGYGHGVGMSQYGANEMAKKGSTYKEILLHYYTGVTIEKSHLDDGSLS